MLLLLYMRLGLLLLMLVLLLLLLNIGIVQDRPDNVGGDLSVVFVARSGS